MFQALKISSILVVTAALVGCGTTESHLSAPSSAVATYTFEGKLGQRLFQNMAIYDGAVQFKNGYLLRGLNTSVTCVRPGTCKIEGNFALQPSADYPGLSQIDLGAFAEQTPKSIQQQLAEAVSRDPDFGIGTTNYVSNSLCEKKKGEYCHPEAAQLTVGLLGGSLGETKRYSALFLFPSAKK